MANRSNFSPEEYRQRPKDLDFGLAEEIIERIGNGETLHDICHGNRDMPMPGTFLLWLEQDPDLTTKHEAARRRGADVNFDEALSIAYDLDTNRARVRSEALRWHVERSHPEKYSPRSVVKTPEGKDDKGGGFDPGAELRRRVEAMAARNAAADKTAQPSQS